MDPGTSLAIVGIALQVTKGLLRYFELWKNSDDDIVELQRSLLWLVNIFTRLDITLRKPSLQEDVVSVIRITMKGCEVNVQKLQELLQIVEKEGTKQGPGTKFKILNRRILHIYHGKDIQRIKTLLDDLREDLKLAISILDLNTSATTLEDLRQVHVELNNFKKRIEEESRKSKTLAERTAKERKKALAMSWLSPCDISTAHSSAVDQRESGTGQWFLNGPSFKNWRLEGSQHLWISGDVGCGKTVLCASIIQELRRTRPEQHGSPDNVIYFYFAFNDPNRQDTLALLKCLLAQLCVDDATLAVVESVCRRYSPDPPSTQVLIATFLEALSVLLKSRADQSQRHNAVQMNHSYIVLDGLDEVPYGPERSKILRLLKEVSALGYSRLHFLVCSRQEMDIRSALLSGAQWRSFSIPHANIEEDLDVYITKQISTSPKLQSQPENVKREIKNKLVHGASGMFRWAALQMQELKMRRILRSKDIKMVLSSLPKDLDSTYERILASISPSLADEAMAALKWLACASRPLFLEELTEACIIRPDDAEPFEEDERLSGLDIMELLPGLMRIDPAPEPSTLSRVRYHTVSLAHFSVMEYLFSSRVLSGFASSYHINSSLAQRHITRSCLAYIARISQLQLSSHQIATQYPLALYAYARWSLHASCMSTNSLHEIYTEVLGLFRSGEVCLQWITCALRTLKMREENQPVWLAVPFEAYESCLWPRYYLLCHAAITGNEFILKALLDDGLEVRGGSIMGEPLRLAITSRHWSFASNLLTAGYQPNKAEMLHAVRHASEGFLRAVMKNAPALELHDMLTAVDTAANHAKHQHADLLMDQLLTGELTHDWKPDRNLAEVRVGLCSRILKEATRLNSSILIEYLLEYLQKFILGHLDMSHLLLGATIQGKDKAAAAFRSCSWAQLSKSSLEFHRNWNHVIVPDETCFDLLELYHRCCQRGVSYTTEVLGVFTGQAPKWNISCEDFESSRRSLYMESCTKLYVYFEAFRKADYTGIRSGNASKRFRGPLKPYDRLFVYQILMGPHSSPLWSLYHDNMMQRQNLGLLAGYLTRSLYTPRDHSSTQLFDLSFSDKIVSILGDLLHRNSSHHPDEGSHAAGHTGFLQTVRDGVRKWHGQRKLWHGASLQRCVCDCKVRRPREQPLSAIIRLSGQSITLRRADALDFPLFKQENIFNKQSYQFRVHAIVAESNRPFLSLLCSLNHLSFSPSISSVFLLLRVNDLLPHKLSQLGHSSAINRTIPSSAGPLTSAQPLRQPRVRSLGANEKANPSARRALAAQAILRGDQVLVEHLQSFLAGEDLYQPGSLLLLGL